MITLDPHAHGPLLHAGEPLEAADGAVILIHGRGGSAEDILSLHTVIRPDLPGRRLAWLAPEANGRTWYPNSFLASRADNEPYLSSALNRIASVIAEVEAAGIPKDRIVLGGFSQGACLSSEFLASHPARFAGLLVLTGGLVGPLGTPVTEGARVLDGMPALVVSGDPDPHIPWQRVEETAAVLARMGANVTLRRYPGRPHTVASEETKLAKLLLEQVFAATAGRG